MYGNECFIKDRCGSICVCLLCYNKANIDFAEQEMVAMLQIRRAREEDLAQIAALYVENWQTTYRGLLEQSFLDSMDVGQMQEKWRQYLSADGCGIFVACDDGIFLGFGAFKADSKMKDCVYLASLQVCAVARGRGIGTQLIKMIARCALQDGYRRMSICIVKGNDNARNLYVKLGAEHYEDFIDDFGGALSHSEKLIWTDMERFR